MSETRLDLEKLQGAKSFNSVFLGRKISSLLVSIPLYLQKQHPSTYSLVPRTLEKKNLKQDFKTYLDLFLKVF